MVRLRKRLMRNRKTNTAILIGAVLAILKIFGVPLPGGAEERTLEAADKIIDLAIILDGLFAAYGVSDKMKRLLEKGK